MIFAAFCQMLLNGVRKPESEAVNKEKIFIDKNLTKWREEALRLIFPRFDALEIYSFYLYTVRKK